MGQLLAYLRHLEPTDDLVELAMDRRSTGVVGIDLAGPEAGFPASRFRAQFDLARDHGIHVTIHAGEADGPSSIADAVDCGAQRIGHGVRLLEDIDGIPDTEDVPAIEGTEDAADTADTDGITAAAGLRDAATPAPSPAEGPASGASTGFGPVAARVHREQICLEVCPSSNLQTGAASDLARHAVGRLHALGFAIAVSSDNRLMSRTSTSREMALAAESCGWTLEDLEQIVLTGLDAGFAPSRTGGRCAKRSCCPPSAPPARPDPGSSQPSWPQAPAAAPGPAPVTAPAPAPSRWPQAPGPSSRAFPALWAADLHVTHGSIRETP